MTGAAAPGPLYGISADRWAALAVAVTWSDQHELRCVETRAEAGA